MVLLAVEKLWLPRPQQKKPVRMFVGYFLLWYKCPILDFPSVPSPLISGCRFINLQVSSLTDKWYGESQKLAAAVFSLVSIDLFLKYMLWFNSILGLNFISFCFWGIVLYDNEFVF